MYVIVQKHPPHVASSFLITVYVKGTDEANSMAIDKIDTCPGRFVEVFQTSMATRLSQLRCVYMVNTTGFPVWAKASSSTSLVRKLAFAFCTYRTDTWMV